MGSRTRTTGCEGLGLIRYKSFRRHGDTTPPTLERVHADLSAEYANRTGGDTVADVLVRSCFSLPNGDEGAAYVLSGAGMPKGYVIETPDDGDGDRRTIVLDQTGEPLTDYGAGIEDPQNAGRTTFGHTTTGTEETPPRDRRVTYPDILEVLNSTPGVDGGETVHIRDVALQNRDGVGGKLYVYADDEDVCGFVIDLPREKGVRFLQPDGMLITSRERATVVEPEDGNAMFTEVGAGRLGP